MSKFFIFCGNLTVDVQANLSLAVCDFVGFAMVCLSNMFGQVAMVPDKVYQYLQYL